MMATSCKRDRSIYDEEQERKRTRVSYIIPNGWVDCPNFGKEIGLIIPSKAPLSDSFNESLPPNKTYNFRQWLLPNRTSKKLGLVIDLTYTTRYYNPNRELIQQGIQYVKIPCSGHDSVPDDVSVNKFVYEIEQFEKRNVSSKFVLVHCTHGFNRTGFMIVHYLMRSRSMMSVTKALKTFSDAREPGIYKRDYIDELYSFYHEVKPTSFVCPLIPAWKESGDDDDALFRRVLQESKNQKKKMSNDDVLGAEIPYNQEVFYQKLCYKILNIDIGRGGSMAFPGSHPVSLDREGLQLLRQRYYYVTWKADGTRYLMLLTREGCYLIDRKFRFRRVQMRFPSSNDRNKMHHYTLLDGEMVIDTFKDGNRECQVRRYLVYDLVAINGKSVTELPFSERWNILDREVIRPRNDEKKVTSHWYRYELESFGVRIKAFCLLSSLEKKLFNELIPSLSHEADGLIFQGRDDRYVFRTNHGLLKWKSADKNSVDFLVEIGKDGRLVLFLHEHGKKKLMENYSIEFRGNGWEKNLASYSGKLLECSWDDTKKVWVSMRVRVDKSTPNDIKIARNVIKSINDNITKEVLLDEIKQIIRLPMYVERIRIDIQEAQRRKHGNRKV